MTGEELQKRAGERTATEDTQHAMALNQEAGDVIKADGNSPVPDPATKLLGPRDNDFRNQESCEINDNCLRWMTFFLLILFLALLSVATYFMVMDSFRNSRRTKPSGNITAAVETITSPSII